MELDHRPNWLEEITAIVPSNIIEFPFQKIMTAPQLVQVEYKFEIAKTKKGEDANFMQGCLF